MKKNKLLKTCIVTLILISLHTMAIAVTTGVVNVDTARVRKKATTDSGIVALVSIGDKITITGEDGNWYKVKAGGKEGYIRKDLLTVEGEIVTIPNNEQEEPEDNNTNVTDEPNEGNQPTSNGETPNEELPNQNNVGGTELNNKTINTLKSAEGVSAGQKINLTEEINIKILPLANSTNIAKLEANTEVTVIEVINNWCRIETGEYVGWVRIDQ